MALLELTATEQLRQLEAGELTSVDLTEASLERIAQVESRVQAFTHLEADAARRQAADVDRRRRQKDRLGRLAGLPVAVKDVLCTRDAPTSCASRMLADFRPPYDATVIRQLRAADAILIGKTNMDEFAMGGSTESSARYPTRNPWDLARSPGGSSGGAAACVAAGMVPLSVGSDTGGSIRQPAGLCGVVGLKPTYGRVSRYGLVAFASSLDQVGPLARSVKDAALLLETLAGHDPRDSTSANVPVPPFGRSVDEPLNGLRLGVVPEHFAEGLDADVEQSIREALRVYKTLGAEIREIPLPHARYAVATYYVIAPCEASSNLARYDGVHYGYRWGPAREAAGVEPSRSPSDADPSDLVRLYRRTRAEGFGMEVKRRIMLGTYALSAGYYDAYYLKASKVRRLIRHDFDDAFRQVDLIAGPVTAAPAFELGELIHDPLKMYLIDLYTVSANLAGIPAMSIPCGFSRSGMPIGLQLLAPPFGEETLLRGAYRFEQETDWHRRCPSL